MHVGVTLSPRGWWVPAALLCWGTETPVWRTQPWFWGQHSGAGPASLQGAGAGGSAGSCPAGTRCQGSLWQLLEQLCPSSSWVTQDNPWHLAFARGFVRWCFTFTAQRASGEKRI